MSTNHITGRAGDAGKILVIGSGVFGMSMALELSKRGHKNITILDRYLPPVIDGSSVDISRVIRTEYADPLYARMAHEALDGWKSEYQDYYYQSGFVMLSETPKNYYVEKIKEILREKHVPMQLYADANEIKRAYPAITGDLTGANGYTNGTAGWANAEGAIQALAQKCSLAGISFCTGKSGTVLSLQTSDNHVTGVKVASGETISATRVIVATGAWTNRLLNLTHAATSSGQPVGFIQLTPEEGKAMSKLPVIINMTSGVFCFPPTPDKHILKVARHGFGYATAVSVENDTRTVSSPRRDGDNVTASFIPEDAEAGLRAGLRQLLPQFADRPWMNRRLCWYTDTPEGDFIADEHPKYEGVFIATGGAGHAFKFLPILGKYLADCYEGKAPPSLRQKWRLRQPVGNEEVSMAGDGSRAGPPRRILSAVEQSML